MESRKTPLYNKHLEAKSKIVDFSGWALPVEYSSVLKEAKAVRTSCGLFDVSHMGEIYVQGKGALEFLQRLATNDISLLKSGRQQYNLFLNPQGGVIDDLMIYNLGQRFLCVPNASNKDKVLTWMHTNRTADVEINDDSDRTALLALQGPDSEGLANEIFGQVVADLGYMHCIHLYIDNRHVLISRSGYTGEDGYELYIKNADAVYWWDKITATGARYGLALCGLGSRDILRIEAGYPLYGHEINDNINPLEAGLGWAVKFNKDFIGKEAVLKIQEKGVLRKRYGFIMEERAVPRQGYAVYAGDKQVGTVCSGTFSPNLDKFIGMALLEGAPEDIQIKVREQLYKAKTADFPFVEPGVKKVRAAKGNSV